MNKGFHLHAYLKLERRMDVKNPQRLHFKGKKDNRLIKGNYQKAKSVEKIINYINKEIFNINDEETLLVSENIKVRMNALGGGLDGVAATMIRLAENGEIEKAMQLVKSESPNQYLRSHSAIEKSLREIYTRKLGVLKPKYTMRNFKIPAAITAMFSNIVKNINQDQEAKNLSFYVKGGAGIGKTELLLTLFNYYGLQPLIITHIDGLRNFLPGSHNCILLDDCPIPKNMQREQLIKIFDSEHLANINVKHGNVLIPQGIPRIFLTNNSFNEVLGEFSDDSAINRRIHKIDLGDSSLMVEKKRELIEQN